MPHALALGAATQSLPARAARALHVARGAHAPVPRRRLRCLATAVAVSLPVDNSSSRGNSAGAGTSGGAQGASAGPAAGPSRTVAAAVAAQFPAVPPLPPPPDTAQLRNVVPYLLGLALSEARLGWRMAGALCCIAVAKMAGVRLPMTFKMAVDSLAETAAGVPSAVNGALLAVLTYAVLDCVRVVAKEAQSPVFAPVSQAVTRRVAYHTFSHVLCLDTRFHLDRRTGRVSRILERGMRSIGVLYRALIFTFLPTGLELAAVAALLSSRFGALLGAILAATFAAYVAWTVTMTQLATDVRKEVNTLDNLTSSKAVDALLNFETVTLFNNQRLEVGQYDRHLRDFQSAALRTEHLAAGLNAGQGLILAAGMAAILAAIIGRGGATGGDVVMASGLIVQLWAPLQFLGWFYRELRAALVDMEEFFSILQTRSNIVDGTQPLPRTPAPAPARAAPSPRAQSDQQQQQQQQERAASASSSSSSSSSSPACGEGLEVELVDVSFGYTPERQILRGVSLRVAPGESVAVVGGSGSGKSTILKLVTRLYDVWPNGQPPQPSSSSSPPSKASSPPADSASTSSSGGQGRSSGGGGGGGSSGRADGGPAAAAEAAGPSGRRPPGVYVNGVDVRQLRLADLRCAIAVVPQDTALNYDTILENIRYGRPDATDEEVIAAARAARLHATVEVLPDGYNTLVGERGLKLSGGEKQRVAIARAFLRAPRLLVCDEATSALDSATEAGIMDSLKELAAGRSTLFVAHRLSTVRGCDRIVVLRGGAVVEQGSHEQLMAARGEYAAMWELQANQAEEGRSTDDDGGLTDVEADLPYANGGGSLDSVDSVSEPGLARLSGPRGLKAAAAMAAARSVRPTLGSSLGGGAAGGTAA